MFSGCSDLESSKRPPGFVDTLLQHDEEEQQPGNLVTPMKISQTVNPVFQSFSRRSLEQERVLVLSSGDLVFSACIYPPAINVDSLPRQRRVSSSGRILLSGGGSGAPRGDVLTGRL